MGISGRGGARTGGGRPSPWQHQPTCTIRVPEIFAETLLEIARELDKGLEETLVIDPKSHGINRQAKKELLSLSQLRIYKHSGHKVLRLEELVRALQGHLELDRGIRSIQNQMQGVGSGLVSFKLKSSYEVCDFLMQVVLTYYPCV